VRAQPARWVAASASALRGALANRDLRRIELAWAGSNSAEFVSVVAYRAGGATAVGMVAVIQMVPAMVVAPLAGVLGDRFRRELVTIASDLVRGATMALAAVAAALDGPAWTVYLLAAALAVAGQAYYPAQAGLVPLVARAAEDVSAASATSSLIRNGAALVAPALSGLLLLVTGVTALFVVSAGAFAAAALVLARVRRTDEVRTAPPRRGALRDVADGCRAAWRDRNVGLVLALFAAHGVGRGAVGVLLVVVPIEILALGESGVGFVNATLGLGGLLGAAATAGLVGRRKLAVPMAAGLGATGAALVLAGAVPAAPVVFAAIAAVGVGFSVVSVVGSSLLVRSTRDDVFARVVGLLGTVRSGAMALGAALAPALVAVGGARLALAVSGALLLGSALAARGGARELDTRSEVPAEELRLLRAAPVFASILPVAVERLAARLEPVAVPAGAEVVRQGDRGDCVYLVAEGSLEVETDGRVLERVGRCDVFGEMALLRNAPRNATVRALEDSRLYRLDRDEFLAAVTGHPVSSKHASDLVARRLDLRERVLGEG
jgi:MFS family permease